MLAGLPRICKPWVQQDTPSHKQSEDHPGRHAVSTSASHMHPCAHTQVFVNSCRHTHIHTHYTQYAPKLFSIFKRRVYLLLMHVSVFLCEFVCIRHVWSHGGQKRESDPLAPELQAVATCLIGELGTEPQSSTRTMCILTCEPSFQYSFIGCGATEARKRFFGLSYRKPLLTQSDLGALAGGPSDSGG